MNKFLDETKQFLGRAQTHRKIMVQSNLILGQDHVFQTSSKLFRNYLAASKWKKKASLTHSSHRMMSGSRRIFKSMRMRAVILDFLLAHQSNNTLLQSQSNNHSLAKFQYSALDKGRLYRIAMLLVRPSTPRYESNRLLTRRTWREDSRSAVRPLLSQK